MKKTELKPRELTAVATLTHHLNSLRGGSLRVADLVTFVQDNVVPRRVGELEVGNARARVRGDEDAARLHDAADERSL